LSCEYLREFLKKFKTALLVYSGAWGKLIHEKNQNQTISWHCPYKYFWHIRRRFCIDKTTIKLPLSPCTLKVFRRHYRIWLNTSGLFCDYDKALLAYCILEICIKSQ
jgi:hypothetical protein